MTKDELIHVMSDTIQIVESNPEYHLSNIILSNEFI